MCSGLYAFLSRFLNIYLLSAGLLSAVLTLLVIPGFAQGYRLYTRKLSDGKPGGLQDLFSPFKDLRRIVKLELWIFLFSFLWSLLFIIPGIVAFYRYRFAYYILMDYPDFSAKDALEMSANLTKGYKWDLFVLDLSFIGWNLLSCLTCGVLSLWIMPYQMAVEAESYHYITYEKFHMQN